MVSSMSELSSRRELFTRHPSNPLLTYADWPYPVNVVFNPAAALVDEETIVLARVEGLDGISHLSVARSKNGVDGWRIDPEPFLQAREGIDEEMWGFEDARAVFLPELDKWAVTATCYGPPGPAVYLALTKDFISVERKGIIMPPDDKNACLLPERINGEWVLLHRPTTAFSNTHHKGGIFCSRSTDLISWSGREQVMSPREGAWWDAKRIGIGPPPIKTEHGWLLVYHGVKETVAGAIYRIGLALLDLENPAHVLKRKDNWVFGPDADYERIGDIPNVVFPCGLLHTPGSDELRLYYGGADSIIALATASLSELVESVLAS
jgi:predicted GH43/DUF377 family glycosyl hydrolase